MSNTVDMMPKTLFGKWLLDNMLANEWTCRDVAEKLHTTRQNVCYHVIGKTKPMYVWVIAYCRLFNDDPDVIWELVQST